jgi:predicted secreted protein
MRRILPFLLALLLGAGTAVAAGCGDRSNLIPANDAQSLKDQLAQIRQDVDAGNCDGITTKVQRALNDAERLDGQVDRRLRSRLNDGLRALRTSAATDCAAAQTDTQTTETQTTETLPETTTTETQTETVAPATTDTTPATPTETVPSTTTPTETTTEPVPPADNGGTPPDEVVVP